jgi:homoserine dehydrogenase
MSPPVIRIGLIGHGTVGSAFVAALRAGASRLERRTGARLTLGQVAVRDPSRHTVDFPGAELHDDALALVRDPSIDIVVEASGDSRAGVWINSALERGIPVVTANKLALATDRRLLDALARHDPFLWCEGAVAAAVPIVRAVRDSLGDEEILGIRGVLNATTTLILSLLESGSSFEHALRTARELGFTELDASDDLSGRDAAAKIAILATLAWRRPVHLEQVSVRGISPAVVDVLGEIDGWRHCVRLVAEATPGAPMRLTVSPRVIERTDPLANSWKGTCAVQIRTALAGSLSWFGAGAGGDSTASALIADTAAATRIITHRLVGGIAA